MRRTQLYLEDDIWQALHAHARKDGVTISQLVRDAVRERYLGKLDQRRNAMQAFAGLRKDRVDLPDTTEYLRELRSGTRLERLQSE